MDGFRAFARWKVHLYSRRVTPVTTIPTDWLDMEANCQIV